MKLFLEKTDIIVDLASALDKEGESWGTESARALQSLLSIMSERGQNQPKCVFFHNLLTFFSECFILFSYGTRFFDADLRYIACLIKLLGRVEYDRRASNWEYHNELQGVKDHAEALRTLGVGRDAATSEGFEGNIGVGMRYLSKSCIGFNMFGGFKGRPDEVLTHLFSLFTSPESSFLFLQQDKKRMRQILETKEKEARVASLNLMTNELPPLSSFNEIKGVALKYDLILTDSKNNEALRRDVVGQKMLADVLKARDAFCRERDKAFLAQNSAPFRLLYYFYYSAHLYKPTPPKWKRHVGKQVMIENFSSEGEDESGEE